MNLYTVWVLICSCMICFMQAGFTCYEAGLIKTKNIIAVAIENLITLMISAIMFFLFGYAIMFGTAENIAFSSIGTINDYAFALMQLMYATICITIFGGAMSERTRTNALLAGAAISSVLIYPVFGRWVWNSEGWLNSLGFMDFAGGSVVHLSGGLIALAGIISVGKRKDSDSGKSNVPFAVLGVFILWFGWMAFAGGSCPAFTERVPVTLLNTTIAAAFGMAGSLSLRFLFKKRGQFLISIFDGILGGLAAITACSYYVKPCSAAVIAFTAGAVAMICHYLLKHLDIDDAVDAVPVHLAGGITGLVLLPIFAEQQFIVTSSRIAQLGIQCIGISVNIVWTFGLSLLMFQIIKRTIGLRESTEAEEKGLNITEFEDIYSWEHFMEKSEYQEQIYKKNKLLRKQARLITVTEEQEKNRIRQELHDGVGQSLAALKLILGMAKNNPDNPDLVENAIAMTDDSIKEMRAILNNLNPPKLEEGLEKAIEALCISFSAIDGVTCTMESSCEIPPYDETHALNIFRVIQEACSNAVKHGDAENICVSIKESGSGCIFEISDDGKGFHVSEKKFGMGIQSMTDRMRMLGGDFSIYSTVGEGTRVVAEVPYGEQ